MIEQAKFAYSTFRKVFENNWRLQKKTNKCYCKSKQKTLEALTNKDGHKSIYKEIFDKLIKEKNDGIKELTYKIDHDHLYLKNDTVKKRINYFDDGIDLFKKLQSGEMKLQ